MRLRNILLAAVISLSAMLSAAEIGPISMQPNPAHNQVTITWQTAEQYKIEIYSVLGQLVYQQKQLSSNTSIDIQNLPNGIYLVRISNGETQVVKRLKVNH